MFVAGLTRVGVDGLQGKAIGFREMHGHEESSWGDRGHDLCFDFHRSSTGSDLDPGSGGDVQRSRVRGGDLHIAFAWRQFPQERGSPRPRQRVPLGAGPSPGEQDPWILGTGRFGGFARGFEEKSRLPIGRKRRRLGTGAFRVPAGCLNQALFRDRDTATECRRPRRGGRNWRSPKNRKAFLGLVV